MLNLSVWPRMLREPLEQTFNLLLFQVSESAFLVCRMLNAFFLTVINTDRMVAFILLHSRISGLAEY